MKNEKENIDQVLDNIRSLISTLPDMQHNDVLELNDLVQETDFTGIEKGSTNFREGAAVKKVDEDDKSNNALSYNNQPKNKTSCENDQDSQELEHVIRNIIKSEVDAWLQFNIKGMIKDVVNHELQKIK